MNSKQCEPKGAWYTASGSSLWIALLIAALMLLSLTGCTARWAVYPVIDSRLTAPVEQPQLQGRTNRDVWRLAIEQREVIEDCADRMRAMRELTR